MGWQDSRRHGDGRLDGTVVLIINSEAYSRPGTTTGFTFASRESRSWATPERNMKISGRSTA
jgi:hypothetical protein